MVSGLWERKKHLQQHFLRTRSSCKEADEYTWGHFGKVRRMVSSERCQQEKLELAQYNIWKRKVWRYTKKNPTIRNELIPSEHFEKAIQSLLKGLLINNFLCILNGFIPLHFFLSSVVKMTNYSESFLF